MMNIPTTPSPQKGNRIYYTPGGGEGPAPLAPGAAKPRPFEENPLNTLRKYSPQLSSPQIPHNKFHNPSPPKRQ